MTVSRPNEGMGSKRWIFSKFCRSSRLQRVENALRVPNALVNGVFFAQGSKFKSSKNQKIKKGDIF